MFGELLYGFIIAYIGKLCRNAFIAFEK